VLGGFIFLFYAYVNDGFTEENKKIVIMNLEEAIIYRFLKVKLLLN